MTIVDYNHLVYVPTSVDRIYVCNGTSSSDAVLYKYEYMKGILSYKDFPTLVECILAYEDHKYRVTRLISNIPIVPIIKEQ